MTRTPIPVRPLLVKRTNERTKLHSRSGVAVTEGLLPTQSAFHFQKFIKNGREQTGGIYGRF